MKEKLIELLNNSHSPYSDFRVSAVLETKDGKEFVGVNVENAAYGSSICAERSARESAVSKGYKKHDFSKLYVMCDNSKIGMQCCACRQVFLELFDLDMQIICMNPDGEEEMHTVRDLCPYPFNDEDLK